ncbi:hypothetical protein GWN63_03950, partial [Candidatus Bathyarchaeota archaeon]|nr:hypothetical protein [Candidatus Bathyarchaeota archaeon]NIR15975.1 hypothetical protein [Desulfobacterales bacterium]NIU81383.1 hypothetical protein [Candidatus Bathyarchaeota archaeon]NIV68003.1 hypothetical protein [Candidatus Bathyarchaeota archaeon]NIW34543.1 hypothetical protein [Candidatus Bathyarchaeota archaeon]
MAYYLIDGEAAPEGVKLIFYNPSTNTWKERVNRDCRPYLLVPHPLSQADQKAVDELDARTKIEEKIDLFTGQTINVTKIELTDSSSPRRASSRFEKAWEDRVPPILSYVYDRDLVFGGQHTIQEDHVEPVFQLSEEIEQRFMQEFSDLKKVDSEKFKLLKRWLALCSQPVPKISAERLGIDEAADPRQYQLAFMLSRVANLPVSQAFSNRQVSGWIRSILHNYLRRKNILIPTSRELRRGEEKRRVRGALT